MTLLDNPANFRYRFRREKPMKRPLLPVVLLYAGGILLARFVPIPLALNLGIALGLAAVALAWTRARPYLLYPLVFLAGCADFMVHTAILSPDDLRRVLGNRTELLSARGTLCQTPSLRHYELGGEKDSRRSLAQVDVTALRLDHQDWRPASGRMVVTAPGELTNFFAGQRVELTGVAARPKAALAPGMFDYRAFLSEQGIYYQLQTESQADWQVISSPASAPLADRFQAWGRRALALGLPCEDEALRLEWALTLGWKTALTEEVARPFVEAATYHIFAVDGLRMGIVFGILFTLCRTLRLPRAISGLLLLPAIWFYVALTGWPASAIRATVMLTVIIVGWVLKRPSDLLNSLFAAALILLTWEPRELFQAGFQLSFLVVLCIVLIMPRLRDLGGHLTAPDPFVPEELWPRWRRLLRRPMRFVEDLTLSSLGAWLGSLPLVAYYFHLVTPVSTPANILAVPLCGLVLVSNLASLLLAAWFPAAAELFNHAGWFLMQLIRVVSQWFAHWPVAYFYLPEPDLGTIVLYYAVLLAALTGWLFQGQLRQWKIAVLSTLLLAWSWRCWQEASTTCLTILTFNGGSAIFSDEPGSKNDLLIDCGTTNNVAYVIEPFLRSQGVNSLACLALSAGESHQVGGARMVVDEFSAKRICASPAHFRSPVYRQILAELAREPGKVRTMSRGNQIGRWQVLHPDAADHFSQADDSALVLWGDFGGMRILLLSDLGRGGQEALAGRAHGLRADIVVTGMPTSGEPLCDALLEAVQPQVIVVADSDLPVNRRAGPKLCERLAQRNSRIIYTRAEGSVTVEVDKSKRELRTMSGTVINLKR